MNFDKKILLERIMAFPLDESGVDLPFSHRLARENSWTDEFAARVIREYKRFVYLAMTANHPVTPSDAVDQAWHLLFRRRRGRRIFSRYPACDG